MSKISQELKVLLYLNQRYARTTFISIKEIAEYLEVSDRQARRYIEDLCAIPDIDIQTKLGREGGYRLRTPLDKGFAMPENIVLAMSIAMKRNERVEEVLAKMPNYVVTNYVDGDNRIDNAMLDKLEVILQAIEDQKELAIEYKDHLHPYVVQPYRILFTNHTYYLFLVHDDAIKKFDVGKMKNVTQLASFRPKKEVLDEIHARIARYGIKDDTPATLRVKCVDEEALKTFDRYFEGKGSMDVENLIYEVTGNSENELFYPLFRVRTKSYHFLDEDFRDRYIHYLQNQIRSLKGE